MCVRRLIGLDYDGTLVNFTHACGRCHWMKVICYPEYSYRDKKIKWLLL